MTVGALQLRQIGGLQAPALPLQTGLIPAQDTGTTDWMSQLMPMMMMMIVMVMMMKMMGKVTEKM